MMQGRQGDRARKGLVLVVIPESKLKSPNNFCAALARCHIPRTRAITRFSLISRSRRDGRGSNLPICPCAASGESQNAPVLQPSLHRSTCDDFKLRRPHNILRFGPGQRASPSEDGESKGDRSLVNKWSSEIVRFDAIRLNRRTNRSLFVDSLMTPLTRYLGNYTKIFSSN